MKVEAIVLDASATAAWLLPDERSAAAERVYAQLRARRVEAHAPELWLWECSNIVVNAVRRSRVMAADAAPLLELLDAVRSRVELVVPEAAQVRATALLAVDRGLSVYDAAYLWLAGALRLPLLTHDARLAAAAATQGVACLRHEDLAGSTRA